MQLSLSGLLSEDVAQLLYEESAKERERLMMRPAYASPAMHNESDGWPTRHHQSHTEIASDNSCSRQLSETQSPVTTFNQALAI
jgi:hypothetical protein